MTKELKSYAINEIPGMIKFDLPVHEDHRGWFKENFQKEKMVELGFPIDFFTSTEREGNKLQNNISFSKAGVLRGLHAEPWDKYISVANNAKVRGCWVDLREGESFGNVYSTIIDKSVGIYVPKGVANGFQVLGDEDVAYTYLVNDYWKAELKPEYAFLYYADPVAVNYWEGDISTAIISEDDKHHPTLDKCKRFSWAYNLDINQLYKIINKGDDEIVTEVYKGIDYDFSWSWITEPEKRLFEAINENDPEENFYLSKFKNVTTGSYYFVISSDKNGIIQVDDVTNTNGILPEFDN